MKRFWPLLLVLPLIVSAWAMAFVPAEAGVMDANIDTSRQLTIYPSLMPQSRVSFNDMSYSNGRLSFPVRGLEVGFGKGDSMLPISGTGTMIILSTSFDKAALKPGDYVGIKVQQADWMPPYWHQLIRKERDAVGEYWITKGVNNAAEDFFPVRQADIHAVAIGVIW